MTNKNKFQKFALVLYIIFVIILFVLFSSVLIKTAQRGDSLSSTGDFSRDGVMDYETTEQNDTSEQDTEGSYELIQGVNGQYEYRCTKICSEECGRACDTCLMNGKSSKRSPKCTVLRLRTDYRACGALSGNGKERRIFQRSGGYGRKTAGECGKYTWKVYVGGKTLLQKTDEGRSARFCRQRFPQHKNTYSQHRSRRCLCFKKNGRGICRKDFPR